MGQQKKSFIIHKGLLCHYSDYFGGAFNGSFRESAERKLPLPHEQVCLFEVFRLFLYTNQILNTENVTGPEFSYTTLTELWVFGDKYLAPTFQNAIMDCIIKRNETTHTVALYCLPFIYANTLPGSPLRRVIVDIAAYKGAIEDFVVPPHEEHWSAESLRDLVLTLYRKHKDHVGKNEMPKERGKCYYHIHKKGEKCE